MTCCAATGFVARTSRLSRWPAVRAKIPLVAQRLSAHTKASVITAVQPALATAVGAVKLSARQPIAQQDGEREETTIATLVGAATGSFATSTTGLATTGRFIAPTDAIGTPTGAFTASTGTFDIPTAGALFDDPSERLTELAWSQADDSDDEPVAYTGEPYDIDDNRATPSQLMQLPKVEPIDPVRTRGTRLPQLFLGLAALVSMVAIGGVAFTLTSSNRAPTLPSSSTPAPPPPLSSQLPSSSPVPPPPPPSSEAPPPPAAQQRSAPAAALRLRRRSRRTCHRLRRAPRHRPPRRLCPSRRPRRRRRRARPRARPRLRRPRHRAPPRRRR